MDKNYYFVVTEEKDEKFVSYVLKINGLNNLVGKFDKFKNANICATKKEAEAIASDWNTCAKRNGNYMYA